MDTISILRHATNLLAKTWRPDGTIGDYDDAKYFTLETRQVADIGELSALLTKLERYPKACIIRGRYVGHDTARQRDPEEFKPGKVRKTYDYFDDQPLHAVLVDVDKCSDLATDPLVDPEGAIEEYITSKLPECFHSISYHWQLSNSFGHPNKAKDGLKVHLWFWLERPMTSAQLKAWATSIGYAGDASLFQRVQPHYTSAPVMAEGVVDPVQVRSGFSAGLLGDTVDLVVDAAVLAAETRSGGSGKRLLEVASEDPIARALADKGMIKSNARNGFNIECPFSDEHTSESGETSTQYFLPHTNGHALGQFRCLHAHCSGRSRGQFLSRLGLDEVAQDFSDLTEQAGGQHDRQTRKGVPEAKHLTTDQANAGRIVSKFGKRLIVVAGQWFAWTGKRWEKDDGEVYRCGCMLSKLIHAEADAWRAKKGTTADESEKYAAIAEALVKWAQRSEMKASIEAALGLAKKLLAVSESDVDRNPWLLNCQNGTVDLRTGEIKAHEPDDYITKLAPVDYDATARSDAWETVVARVTLEEGMTTRPLASFLQRWFGYCATGSTREQAFVVHYGQGSNGKSTILDTVADVLGDYAATGAPGLLVGNGKDRHPTEVADLFGRRMVTSHETGEGGQLKEDVVKQLTGGDKVKARFMRADFFEFDPTHKLQLLTNHKPAIKGQDNGIWRRVLLVPYLARFAVAEEVNAGRAHYVRDTSILERLRKERAGVLAWIVRGAKTWASEGLQAPDAVLAASRDYQTEQDRVGQFVADCCEIDPTAREALAGGFNDGLYGAYKEWATGNGVFYLSKQKFAEELKRVIPSGNITEGREPETRRKVRWVHGVRLLPA